MSSFVEDNFGLYLVITNPLVGYERCTEAAVKAGVRFVQLRMKHAKRIDVVNTAKAMRDITRNTNTLFIVNDDPSIAAEADADGVHLGQDDMPISEARSKFPSLKVFGLSTHSFEQASLASKCNPDYIGVGPVYPTPTKEIPDPVLGVCEASRIVLSQQNLPCVAIGGVNVETLPQLIRSGIRNYGIVRAICSSEKPYDEIRKIQDLHYKLINM